MTEQYRPGVVGRQSYPSSVSSGREPANLGDILERVLDRGVVIAGDIRVNLLDIELLTIKLRLIIASVDTAREMGIDWWEHDPWLTGKDRALVEENRRLRDRIAALEEDRPRRRAIEPIEGEVESVEDRPVRRTEARRDERGG
ncbi:gas vesicle protein [Nonomuraea angiospora]|uniref:gas vesicle protein n=1 Tax=Nonomuraea angiospora TaxID=46172 RepID=UPI0033C31A27